MSTIRRYENRRWLNRAQPDHTILTVDGAAVGVIELTEGGSYRASTKGLVPAIDGIVGASANEVWVQIGERVRAGEVVLMRKIRSIEDA